jgi:SAM-dependent methyltransferase
LSSGAVDEGASVKQYFFRRETCRVCGSRNVSMAVPLEPVPIASPNIGLTETLAADPGLRQTVPLDLYRCEDCGHLQLMSVIDPGVQYNTFLYVTSISLGLTEHFGRMAAEISELVPNPHEGRVVEIGSNDGTMLRFFKERGMAVLGIDPARATAEAATRAGIRTLAEFFNAALARRIRQEFGPADIVIANNTLANIDDLDETGEGLKLLLAPGGVFVFETSYGADVVRKNLLDTVYHEHLSYFMLGPLRTYFARHGLELFDVRRIWTKGGSIRGYVQHAGGPHPRSGAVEALIAEETDDALDKAGPYQAMAETIGSLKSRLDEILAEHIRRKEPIAAYGASVGTITLIRQFGLGPLLDAIFDDKPLQEYLAGPDYRIPVLRSELIYERKPACILILAWRYAEPIIKKHQAYIDGGGKFIIPMPQVSVVGGR